MEGREGHKDDMLIIQPQFNGWLTGPSNSVVILWSVVILGLVFQILDFGWILKILSLFSGFRWAVATFEWA